MTAEATFQVLRCFADVLSTTTPGFSCNNVYQIWTISVNFFVDLDAVSFAIDWGCNSWLEWDMVACQTSPSIAREYLGKPSVNTISETKGLCSPTRLETDWDLELGKSKWRGESATLVVVNIFFLQETSGRWSEDTEGNLRGVSKTRGNLFLQFSKFVAILRFR